MTPPLLDVRNLTTWFDIRRGIIPRPVAAVQAVTDVSFTVGEREVLGIAGESGSGKTTIGRSVLRLVEPSSGEIVFDGEDITRLGSAELRAFRRRCQIVFQDPYSALNPKKTIERILAEPFIVQGLAASAAERRERIAALLDLVALGPDFMERMPHELSGGQRQRIVIARAIASEPRFIVADEPISALDVSIQAQIVALLKELKDRLGLSILFISHDLAVMEYLSDRIAVVYLGRVMEIGPASTICGTPHHPYTRALLSAVPRAGGHRRERMVLKGELPNPVSPPSGCVFRTRCPFATAACADPAALRLREKAPGHFSACIRDDI
jgi:oligopeptide/dipeptide ABC transporter ATP-binding protein